MAGPTVIRLAEARQQVINAVHSAVSAGIAPGELLEPITEVRKGNKARRRPDTPYMWVETAGWTVVQGRALHQTYTIPVLLKAMVASEDPEAGWEESQQYAADAASLVLRNRTLGLAFVEDTQPGDGVVLGQFTPQRVFGFASRVDVRISIVEPKE